MNPSFSSASPPPAPAPASSRRRQYPTAQIQQAYNTQAFDPVAQQQQYPQQQAAYPQQDAQSGLFVPGQAQAPEFFSPGLQGQTPVYQQQQHPQPQQGAGVGAVTGQFSQMNMGQGQAQGYAQDVKVNCPRAS